MSKRMQQNRGSVLWVALIATVVAMGVALSLLQTSVSNFKSQDKFNQQANAFFTTHGAVDLVLSDYFGRYNAQPTPVAQPNFVGFLTADTTFTTLTAPSGDTVAEDFRTGPTSYTAATSASASPTKDASTIITRSVPTKFNGLIIGDRMITAVRLYKKERPQPGTYIVDLLVVVETQKNVAGTAAAQTTAVASLSAGDKSEMAQPQWESQMFTFTSPPNYNGFDYAILTKDLSCTMCHLQVRNRSRVNNRNQVAALTASGTAAQLAAAKAQFGTFDRIKVGITTNLTLRQDSMYSLIEGSVYQQGILQYESSHANLTVNNFTGDTAWTTQLNPNATTVYQNPTTGAVTQTPFVNATTTSANSGATVPLTAANEIAIPQPNEPLYLSYGTSSAAQSDGGLPSSNFPYPFPAIPTTTNVTNGSGTVVQTIVGPNPQITSAEITAAQTGMVSAVNPANPSSITGGTAVILPAGTIYNGTTLPTGTTAIPTNVGGSINFQANTISGGSTGSVTPGAANIVQTATGNVILSGTAANPINIDGKVVINGDVVINGYIQGTGQLLVTGNIYMPGDVIYNDANVGTISETFGTAANGQSNLVAFQAGKNIVIGDYATQITNWDNTDANQFIPYSYNTSTKKLTAAPGSTEPGVPLTYVAGSSTNNYVNPSTVSGNLPTITLPSGASYPSGSGLSSSSTLGGANEPNFIVQQMAIYNRDELMKVMPYLPTANPTVASSYTSGGGGIANANYSSTYIPRFYSYYPYSAASPSTNPAWALMYSGSNFVPETSGSSIGTWNGVPDPHGYGYFTSVDNMPSGSISPAAMYAKSVINIAPSWVVPENMLKILSAVQAARVPVIADAEIGTSPSYQVPDKRIDGVLYTNNGVFCIERYNSQYYNPSTGTWSRVVSQSNGRLQLNGAMIAPDTGLLIVDGPEHDSWPTRQNFIVNYDPRVKSFLAVANQDFSSFNQWGVSRVTMVRNVGFAPTAP